jgi:hypothetical protein
VEVISAYHLLYEEVMIVGKLVFSSDMALRQVTAMRAWLHVEHIQPKEEPRMSHRIRLTVSIMTVLLLTLALVGPALAASTGNTGQPNQSCGSSTAQQTPGNAASAPGSAFNPNGVAGTVYAGQQPQNSKNPKSVSQYDVACFQVSQPHP